MTNTVWSARHPSVQHFEPLFAYSHLPEHLRLISAPFNALACEMLRNLSDDSPELSAGLRKLLEAKDCFVRCAVLNK